MGDWTKGPWKVGYNDGSGRFGKHKGTYSSSVTYQNHLLATVWHHDSDDYPKDHPIMLAKANAHLIAAAPDLYEALKGLYHNCEAPGKYLDMANEALRKAKGKS